MTQVLLIIHLIVTVVMIGLILLQRSEGGGLGVGGGGGLGGFAGPRATANMLTKATMTCFGLFVALSLILAIMAGHKGTTSLMDQLDAAPVTTSVPAVSDAPAAPVSEAPAKPNVPVGE